MIGVQFIVVWDGRDGYFTPTRVYFGINDSVQ